MNVGCTRDPERRHADVLQGTNTRIFAKPLTEVWKTGIAALAKRSFAIERLNPSAAVLEISYRGEPLGYIDCGELEAVELGVHGGRSYRFPAAKGSQDYQVLRSGRLSSIQRGVYLQANIRLIFEDCGLLLTCVRAEAKYILTQNTSERGSYEDEPDVRTDTITLNSGERTILPGTSGASSTECAPTGRLERDALASLGD